MSEASRSLFHRRQIDSAGYRRDDGLWEIEARMSDTKTHPMFHPAHGELPRDIPYQAFLVRLVVDDSLELRAIEARITTAPSGECRQVEAAYAGLVGKRIDRGVMREARSLVGGAAGCTNLTELFGIAAVTAIQTVGGASLGDPAGDHAALARIADTCYALREGGEILRAVRDRGRRRE